MVGPGNQRRRGAAGRQRTEQRIAPRAAIARCEGPFADLGIDVSASTPAELASFTRSEIERMAKVIKETGRRAE
jgi:tripartite-type tricarboxylate transporter receptor subunit TctC